MHVQVWPLAFYDSVLVYAHAMDSLLQERGNNWLMPKSLDCWKLSVDAWDQGREVYEALTRVRKLLGHDALSKLRLLTHILQVKADGVMRELNFTSKGHRLGASYDIVRLGRSGWEQVSN